ncbi:YiiX family permuted papain-like enzyme [Chitinophaga nivalis]|uniref:YiiX family permuted papain-like enzyme n=1 Tax=Chitinophaga nivalis TaxID=2991709 RepID=A0ABT3IKW2_9BACT|nr:YiiX family permuted papain-like enzyme [Chitinophaga nivalis]MCW3465758.1 YiiX family permuted papain-like enzyme [Chitinophaga nivalis]MCW3484551.1 YiiX family permuted papain-like enzyme [Chitinophaga nivalis]
MSVRSKAVWMVMLAGLTAGALTAGVPVRATTEVSRQTVADIREGDIIFQVSQSSLSTAIQLATHSKYSHCGIIFKKAGNWYVYEALQPVRYTPLQEWIARGKDKHYVIRRLRQADSVLTPAVLEKMKTAGAKYQGKNYDFYFGWSDDRIYCSELVWKIYKAATGLEIGALQPLKDFDLSRPEVKAKMQEVYGSKLPLSEMIISPVSMYNSPLLVTVTDK